MDRVSERIAVLETKEEVLAGRVDAHEELIQKLDEKLSTLVGEVRQIRNALYLMALSILANIPALAAAIEAILRVLKI